MEQDITNVQIVEQINLVLLHTIIVVIAVKHWSGSDIMYRYSIVEGVTTVVYYCPFCGEETEGSYADGSNSCGECGKVFFVIEKE